MKYLNLTGGNASAMSGNDGRGGAIFGDGSSNIHAQYCSFVNNLAGNHGGAVYIAGGSEAVIQSSSFTNNVCIHYSHTGGAAFVHENCLLCLCNLRLPSTIAAYLQAIIGAFAAFFTSIYIFPTYMTYHMPT